MANDPMTLLERLRNPAYHGSGLTRGKPADLDIKQTVADMAEAANEIDRLNDVLRQIAGMKREDLYLADSELPIDNAAAWTAKNAITEAVNK